MYTDEYEQNRKHVENKGRNCPSCRSRHINDGEINTAADTAMRSMNCLHCGATWTDTFKLTGFVDLKPEVPADFRIMLSRLTGDTEWRVTSNPNWTSTEIACSRILDNSVNRYVEYQNGAAACGVRYRMITVRDAAEYGIGEIKAEWALHPEDIIKAEWALNPEDIE